MEIAKTASLLGHYSTYVPCNARELFQPNSPRLRNRCAETMGAAMIVKKKRPRGYNIPKILPCGCSRLKREVLNARTGQVLCKCGKKWSVEIQFKEIEP